MLRDLQELEDDMTALYNLIKKQYKTLDHLNMLYNALRIELNAHK